ncbi:unnamed protein product [Microthlaspi erraticum]|uniref:Uncharacterized protein n=1 Tax=Microthlaspi erraticum TaxID=1685480 RepID=A0A6D2KEU5_9BRAS|nr:unnamed protein product [Microthlaspi erraticum]CAA7050779.1 unnamed protein product [Microthlaspi erraticum]
MLFPPIPGMIKSESKDLALSPDDDNDNDSSTDSQGLLQTSSESQGTWSTKLMYRRGVDATRFSRQSKQDLVLDFQGNLRRDPIVSSSSSSHRLKKTSASTNSQT